MKKYYVGLKQFNKRDVFQSSFTPTQKSHGEFYNAVIGPFLTKRGACYMADYGYSNSHLQAVNDAERLAKGKG